LTGADPSEKCTAVAVGTYTMRALLTLARQRFGSDAARFKTRDELMAALGLLPGAAGQRGAIDQPQAAVSSVAAPADPLSVAAPPAMAVAPPMSGVVAEPGLPVAEPAVPTVASILPSAPLGGSSTGPRVPPAAPVLSGLPSATPGLLPAAPVVPSVTPGTLLTTPVFPPVMPSATPVVSSSKPLLAPPVLPSAIPAAQVDPLAGASRRAEPPPPGRMADLVLQDFFIRRG